MMKPHYTLFAIFIVICTALAQTSEGWLKQIIREEGGRTQGFSVSYALTNRKNSEGELCIVRSTPSVRISVDLHETESRGVASQAMRHRPFPSDARVQVLESLPSGMPLGHRVRRVLQSKIVNIYTHYDRWSVGLSTGYKGKMIEGRWTIQNQSLQEDWEIAESLARRVMGRLAGTDSRAGAPQQIRGRAVSSRTGIQGDVQLNLTEWAAAQGFRFNYNSETCMASFSRNGQVVILPMASNQIKIGPRWSKTEEISLLHNGEWYVPRALLDAALAD